MKSFFSFFKTTLIGGVFFIVPLLLFLLIIGKVIELGRKLVAPIVNLIPIEEVGGIAVSRLIAYMVLILFCFLAGLFSESKKAIQLREWIEDNILSMIPGYSLIKGMTEAATGLDSKNLKEVVLIDVEEVWQIGFLMDKIDKDLNVVYLPGAPNPMSGDVVIVKNDRLRVLDIPELSVMQIAKKLGINAKTMLNGKIKSTIFEK